MKLDCANQIKLIGGEIIFAYVGGSIQVSNRLLILSKISFC